MSRVPNSIVERFPLTAGNCVLHLSKLLLFDFVLFLEKFLKKNTFKLCYTGYLIYLLTIILCDFVDTDSFAIALVDKNMDNLVKEEKRHIWQEEKAKVFVMDESDASDLRRPGKWKTEFTTTNGSLVW